MHTDFLGGDPDVGELPFFPLGTLWHIDLFQTLLQFGIRGWRTPAARRRGRLSFTTTMLPAETVFGLGTERRPCRHRWGQTA